MYRSHRNRSTLQLKRDYFVPYRDEQGRQPDVLVKAFTDTWNWGTEAETTYEELVVGVGGQVGDTIEGLRKFLNETPMMAYLVMMAIRIVEMHRILKDSGCMYLHCDPTASHYLKIVLDAVFGVENFRNEIVWGYRTGGVSKKWFGRKHDILLFYAKGSKYTFNVQQEKVRQHRKYGYSTIQEFHDELGWYRLSSMRDIWDDINALVGKTDGKNEKNLDRLGYPTQKPIPLYKRLIEASSNENDVVLDPFCGCGTTLMAAEGLNRKWVGIDLTYLATGAVKLQIEKLFPEIQNQITITGTPENLQQALELARTNPFGFEEWAVTHVLKFKANAKKVADGGIDGTLKFPLGRIKGKQAIGTAIAQVKGGGYTLGQIRDFRTAMENEEAEMGVFLVATPPTAGMLAEAAKSGMYEHPSYEFTAPRVQIYQIQDYYNNVLPKLPHAVRDVL